MKRIRIGFEADVDEEMLRQCRERYATITPESDDPSEWDASGLFALIDDGGSEPSVEFPIGNVDNLTIEVQS